MKKVRIILSMMLLTLATAVFAQNVSVSGIITDASNGEPIPGASVLLQGTTTGAIASIDGHYALNAPSNATLVVSSIGYKTVEVPVSGRNVINVALEVDTELLDDVVVVAYGTQSARTMTASVATVKSDVLKDAANVSFDSMLQGQAAGVQVANSSAGVGASAKVLIRGVSSISAGTDPLYIVDGIPISSSTVYQSYTESNALSDINPADILSIDILKDAAATALYGSRAASGVIIITTKTGRSGEAKVTYDMNVGMSEPTKLFNMMDADTYVAYKNQAYMNLYGTDEVSGNPWGPKAFNFMKDDKGNPIKVNWNDLIFKKGFIQNHTVSVSGGTPATQYYMSANYSTDSGIIIGDQYRRMGIRANVSTKINDWLKVGLNAQYSNAYTHTYDASRNGGVIAAAGLPRVAMIMPPIISPYNSDGSYYTIKDGQYIGYGGVGVVSTTNGFGYPNGMAQSESYNKVWTNRLITSGFVELTPIKNLTLKSQLGIDYMDEVEETFWNQNYGQGVNYNGYVLKRWSNMTAWTWTNTADYNLTFGGNTFNFLVGTEAYNRFYSIDTVQGDDVLNPAYIGFRAGYTNYDAGGSEGEKSMMSFFGRINYDYMSKYMLSVNYRRDGLSALGANSKWGDFYGVSAAWRISEEPFFDSLRGVFDDLKINASYGLVGNSEVGYYNAQTYYGDTLYGGLAGLGLSNIGDSSLAWESSHKWDVGLSARLWHRIDFDFDWYYTKTNDLVMAVPQGPSTGIGSLVSNTGSLENRGIEFSIGADIISTDDFLWHSSLNVTTSHNKILSLAEGVDEIYGGSDSYGETNITLPGYSIGQLLAYPTGGIDPETGRRIFYGTNGEWTTYDRVTGQWYLKDGTVFQGNLAPVRAGNSLPTWFGGWTNTFNWKGFDLNLFFQFSGGNWILNSMTATGADNRWWNNFAEVAEKSWKKPGDNAKYAKPYFGDNVSNGSAYDMTDWIERGDYLRLKTVSLGYTFNTGARKKQLGFSSFRIYAQIQNALVFTAFTGLDPEITSSMSDSPVLAGGFYKNTLPQARTYTAGLQITF